MSANPGGTFPIHQPLNSTTGDAPPRRYHPILIIPGLMSSSLMIHESPHKTWKDKRLWINIASVGFNSLHAGGKLKRNALRRRASIMRIGELDKTCEEIHQEYLRQMECKSRWIWHLALQPDMIHEKEGVVARPITGTAGVDYLAAGGIAERFSYVFGPILELLRTEGYKDGVDVDAAPYDWRLPPSVLESRYKYFTNTIRTIEQLYENSNNTRVVLLCHSLGCKVCHYLLNFALGVNGQAWIDDHVAIYLPVGAPHIGAQSSVHATMEGSIPPGLEAFLDKEEGLMLARSFGSLPWLYPLESVAPLPQSVTAKTGLHPSGKKRGLHRVGKLLIAAYRMGSAMSSPQSATAESTLHQPPTMPTAVLRDESSLRIIFPNQVLHLGNFFRDEQRRPPKLLRVAIQIGNDTILRTAFVNVTQEGKESSSLQVNFKAVTWLIACPPTMEQTLRNYPYFQLFFEEPGGRSTGQRRSNVTNIKRLFSNCLKKGADKTIAMFGGVRVIGRSERINWKKGSNKIVKGGKQGTFVKIRGDIETTEDANYSMRGFQSVRGFVKKSNPVQITFDVHWEPSSTSTASTMVVSHRRHKKYGKLHTDDTKKNSISYSTIHCHQVLQMEGLRDHLNLIKDTYEKDPLGPTSLSSVQPPPVKKVTAIYGINLPTEVSAVYKRNPIVRIEQSKTKALREHDSSLDASRAWFAAASVIQRAYRSRCKCGQMFVVLDKDARLSNEEGSGLIIRDGVIWETKNTPQKIIGGGIERKCGDGSVSYWSLQHCRSWQGKCNVTVHEIDGAQHREILNDKRFHALLLQCLVVDESATASL